MTRSFTANLGWRSTSCISSCNPRTRIYGKCSAPHRKQHNTTSCWQLRLPNQSRDLPARASSSNRKYFQEDRLLSTNLRRGAEIDQLEITPLLRPGCDALGSPHGNRRDQFLVAGRITCSGHYQNQRRGSRVRIMEDWSRDANIGRLQLTDGYGVTGAADFAKLRSNVFPLRGG